MIIRSRTTLTGHWDVGRLRFRQSQTDILECQWKDKAGRHEALRDDFGAVKLMDPTAEHRRSQIVENRGRIEAALAHQSERLSEHFHCGRHHGIADDLDQVGALGVAVDDKGALAEQVE